MLCETGMEKKSNIRLVMHFILANMYIRNGSKLKKMRVFVVTCSTLPSAVQSLLHKHIRAKCYWYINLHVKVTQE